MVWVDVFIAISLFLMAFIDLKTRYIYDFHIVFTGVLVCVRLLGGNYLYHLYGAMVGFIIGFLMYKGAYLYYKQEAFGLGDVFLLMLLVFSKKGNYYNDVYYFLFRLLLLKQYCKVLLFSYFVTFKVTSLNF